MIGNPAMTSTSRSHLNSFSPLLLTAAILTVALLAFEPVAFGQAGNPGGGGGVLAEMRSQWDTPHRGSQPPLDDTDLEAAYRRAESHARLANEGLFRCRHYVSGWLKLADPESGLIPRNRGHRYWNAKDSAADNYAFMVLTAALTDRPLFDGRMREMLRSEIRLTSRIDRLPDTYDFASKGFREAKPRLSAIMFGSSEYIKDGLLPLTEWLGPSPWSERMIGMLDDMWKHAPVDTPYGRIVSDNVEVNGELLQTLSRIYWMTGDEKYLDWACRLGDYYLLGGHHPTQDFSRLRLRDHGCEIVSGLCELYATVHFARPKKKDAYRRPIHEMLDRILDIGRNSHGLFYNTIDLRSGKPVRRGIADTWGYTLNGHYAVYLLDKTESYRTATRKALGSLHEHYRNYAWEGSSSDGYADSLESALNLYNREPVEGAARWLDSEIRVMWRKQKADGVIEGWHGDGNFARTTIMYCLWKTRGLTVRPWRKDVFYGAVSYDDGLAISVRSTEKWSSKLIFDAARHRAHMKMPLDWPRINQFPEWFTAEPDRRYSVTRLSDGKRTEYTGAQLLEGIAVDLDPRDELRLLVK
jgi:hypothetical protein